VITGDASVAEDVAQDSFIKAFHALSRFRDGAPFRPWLLKIVANEARNALRSMARRERLRLQVTALPGSTEDHATPEQAALAAEQRQTLLLAIDELRDEDRLVIMSRYFLSLTEAEMGALIGCPKGTVKSRLARALGKLRRNLERDAHTAPSTVERSTPHG
jgi:RNA polymerase sigma factor (sigma-70 family)